jgi:hypothetical protein
MFSQCQSIKWHQANSMLLWTIKHHNVSLNKRTGWKTHVKSITFPFFLSSSSHIKRLINYLDKTLMTQTLNVTSSCCVRTLQSHLFSVPVVTEHSTIPLYGLRLSRQWLWRLLYSDICRRVAWYVTKTSEKYAASIHTGSRETEQDILGKTNCLFFFHTIRTA